MSARRLVLLATSALAAFGLFVSGMASANAYPPAKLSHSLKLSASKILLGQSVTATATYGSSGSVQISFGPFASATTALLPLAGRKVYTASASYTFGSAGKYMVTAMFPLGETAKAFIQVMDRQLPLSGQVGTTQTAVVYYGAPGSVIQLSIGKYTYYARVKPGTTKTVIRFKVPTKGSNTVRMSIGSLFWPTMRIQGT